MKAHWTSTPIRLSIITLSLIFLGEVTSVIVLSVLPPLSLFTAYIIKAIVLLTVVSPALYFIAVSSYRGMTQKVDLSQKVLDSSSEAILITDAHSHIEYVNPAFCAITGYEKDEVIGKTPRIMQSGRHDAEFYNMMWQSLKESGQWQGEVWDRRKNGEIFPKWLSISAVKDEKGSTVKYIGVFTDITSLKQTEEYLEHLTHYDSLTNLPNNILFRDRLKQAMHQADRNKRHIGVMSVDLDNFKYVNDTFGHLAGDQLLKEAAQRLLQSVRENDTVARQSGDKFSIVLTELSDDRFAAVIAQKIIDAISAPFKYKGFEVYLNVRVGITLYPMDSNTIDGLLRNADIAMYRAEEQVDSRFQFYDSEMGNRSFERLSIETNLRQAIEREELVLHYQPNVDLHTGQMISMEALVRRQEREWLVPPSYFIPIAEESGLMIPIIKWTLQTACRQAKRWQDEGLMPLRLAVNVSASQFQEQNLLQMVENTLNETSLDPKYLELELTERVIMHDTKAALQVMHRLKEMGIYLTIDDFGTGYSSLSYLKRLPIDKLKIDISFVRDITSDPNSASIAKAIIALAHTLNLRVLAEGVENEDQLSFLLEHKCDEMQGYYFSIPLPAEAFKKLVLRGKHLEFRM